MDTASRKFTKSMNIQVGEGPTITEASIEQTPDLKVVKTKSDFRYMEKEEPQRPQLLPVTVKDRSDKLSREACASVKRRYGANQTPVQLKQDSRKYSKLQHASFGYPSNNWNADRAR